MESKHECEACGGRGMFVPATPSCSIIALRPPWIVVEKCDTCDKFADDLSASLTEFAIAGWFVCTDGGYHALAYTRCKTHS
ncbi:MAG: hypothetical protein CEE38_10860 [Planctomycetes bacterium B3_Pla]|nr:MAG: hypothetical protein CEE38_10860 [Planctomycetes bacterium B3_Pla]